MGYNWKYNYWSGNRPLRKGKTRYTYGQFDKKESYDPFYRQARGNAPVFCEPQTYLKYHPVGSISGNLYLGFGAGKHLLSDIKMAKQSIRIISPYLSNSLTETLVEKFYAEHCRLSIITSESEGNSEDPLGRKGLILNAVKQQSELDRDKQAEKKMELKKSKAFVAISSFVLFLVTVTTIYLMLSGVKLASLYFLSLLCGMLSLVALYSSISKLKVSKAIHVNRYNYFQMFPFKILKKSNHFVHQKIYIIDDRVAFIGSLNFTENGCYNNLEMSLRIDNPEVIKNLIQYFDTLLSDESIPYYSPQEIKHIYFQEP